MFIINFGMLKLTITLKDNQLKDLKVLLLCAFRSFIFLIHPYYIFQYLTFIYLIMYNMTGDNAYYPIFLQNISEYLQNTHNTHGYIIINYKTQFELEAI